MSDESDRRHGRLRRATRQAGEEVAEELILELAWRLVIAPFRLLGRGLANLDLSP